MSEGYKNRSELKKVLSPFKRRVTLIALGQSMSIALLLSLVYILVLIGVSFLIPFAKMSAYAIYGSLIILILVFLVSIVKRPSWEHVAKVLDRHGLNQRVATALELEGREDIYAKMQRADTVESISTMSPKIIKFCAPKLQLYMGLGLCLAIMIFSLIPNPQRAILKLQREMREDIDKMADELQKKTDKGLEKADELTTEEREKLREIVKSLVEEMEQSEDFREAIAKLSKAQEEIERFTMEIQKNRIKMLASGLGDRGIVAPLSEAISDGDTDKLADEIDKLKDQLEVDTTQEEMARALSEAFKEAKSNLPDGTLKEELTTLADALSSYSDENQDDVLEALGALDALDALEESIARGMSGIPSEDPGDINYLVQEMKNNILNSDATLAREEESDQNRMSQTQGTSGGGQETGNSQDGIGEGSGTNQNRSRIGSSTGAGTGSGEDNGEDDGAGGGSGIGSGHSPEKGAPNRLGDDGNSGKENVQGVSSGSGRVDTIEIHGGMGGVTGPIPYNRVFGTYRRQAMEAIDRKALPPGMEDVVREYFSGLEE